MGKHASDFDFDADYPSGDWTASQTFLCYVCRETRKSRPHWESRPQQGHHQSEQKKDEAGRLTWVESEIYYAVCGPCSQREVHDV